MRTRHNCAAHVQTKVVQQSRLPAKIDFFYQTKMKGYKIFNDDWKCRGYQYQVGETARYECNPRMCRRGFHFCQRAIDCLAYYILAPQMRFAEVLAVGPVVTEGDKSVTTALTVVRELSYDEFRKLCTGVYRSENTLVQLFEGVREGRQDAYHTNGFLESQISYHKGLRDGMSSKWDKDGHKDYDIMFHNGNRHGDCITYHCNGSTASLTKYEHDRRISDRKRWDNRGRALN